MEGDNGGEDPARSPSSPVKHSGPTIQLLAENTISRHHQEPIQEHPGSAAATVSRNPSTASRDYYTSTQWTADGTSLLASSAHNRVSSFVLPSDLLDASSTATRQLAPQATVRLPEPSQVLAPAPYFSLNEPSSQVFLAGCRDHPLQLYHAFPPPSQSDGDDVEDHGSAAPPLASYRLIRHETEEYITPSSMIWLAPGSNFVCGSQNRIDYFDVSRPGSDGPLLTLPTIPSKRHIRKGSGVGMKGTVAALAASPPEAHGGSLIAAGTWTRWLGLYDLHRSDKAVANWSVCGAADDADGFKTADLGGQGIVQVLWSPCGRYLVVNERHSDGLLVYDIRGTGKLLSVLGGRRANAQQKLTCDVFSDPYASTSSFEVWAGSQDGTVSVWEGVGATEGDARGVVDPSWSSLAHSSPVGSTTLHSSGSVVATCSGGWDAHSVSDMEQIGPGTAVFDESSLKVWSIVS